MTTFKELLIAETTEYEFKSALEVNRPKSWLKSVSAFANGIGGSLYFGVDDKVQVVGLDDIKKTSTEISRLIKERMMPLPEFNLSAHRVDDGKDILVLRIMRGNNTPYYYSADGTITAFVRVGDESVMASPQQLNELVMRGKNLTLVLYGYQNDYGLVDYRTQGYGQPLRYDSILKIFERDTPREVIRNYFLNDFFKDHCTTY